MIDLIEDALIALTKKQLTNSAGKPVYKVVDAVPGDISSADTINEMIKVSPSVYWAFVGGNSGMDTSSYAVLDGIWMAFMSVQHAGSYQARLRGDKTTIGLFEMASKVLPAVNGFTVSDAGTLKFRRLQNLFTRQRDKTGIQLYVASFGMQMAFEQEAITLDNFVTFAGESTLAANAPKTETTVTLPTS